MSAFLTHHFRPGDRVDYREHRGAIVARAAEGTLWLESSTPEGAPHLVVAPVSACRPHVTAARFCIGGYVLRHYRAGKVWLANAEGEGGEFDEAALESVLEKFYRRHF